MIKSGKEIESRWEMNKSSGHDKIRKRDRIKIRNE